MLYAMEKLPMPEGDVYALDGYPKGKGVLRDFLKQMVLIMVNSMSRQQMMIFFCLPVKILRSFSWLI